MINVTNGRLVHEESFEQQQQQKRQNIRATRRSARSKIKEFLFLFVAGNLAAPFALQSPATILNTLFLRTVCLILPKDVYFDLRLKGEFLVQKHPQVLNHVNLSQVMIADPIIFRHHI